MTLVSGWQRGRQRVAIETKHEQNKHAGSKYGGGKGH